MGTTLVHACCDLARRLGTPVVTIPVADWNDRARQLYKRLGFEDVDVLDLGDDGEIFGFRKLVIMQRTLND